LLDTDASAQNTELARIVNGFAVGGGADTISRRLAERMSRAGYARSVVVESRTGAGGQIAIQYVKAAPSDGATLLLIPMFAMGIYPHTYKRLAYDPVKDFTPVSTAAVFEYALAVGPAVPVSVTNVAELMAWFKANPASASLGYPATGSTAHFIGVTLERSAKTPIAHVGYRGGQPAVMDMLAGQIPGLICPIGELTQQLKANKCRVLAMSGSQRSRFVPNVPTLAEQGFRDLMVKEWFGIFLPAGATSAVTERANRAIREAVADPGFAESLLAMGFEPSSGSPAELAAALKADSARWGELVRTIGFSAEN
jgi:tripartite-type tricarboxylate transporter receptor subunit TctC